MKTISFDSAKNMTVIEKKTGLDFDGNQIEMITRHDIQPGQLEAHLPMFKADMSAGELAKANAIIAAQ